MVCGIQKRCGQKGGRLKLMFCCSTREKTGDWILGSGGRGGGMGGRVLPISPVFIVKVTQRKLCMAFSCIFS